MCNYMEMLEIVFLDHGFFDHLHMLSECVKGIYRLWASAEPEEIHGKQLVARSSRFTEHRENCLCPKCRGGNETVDEDDVLFYLRFIFNRK